MRVRLFAAMLPFFVAIALAGCSGGPGPDTVRIYSSLPLQGAAATDNQTVVTAIKQALAARNGRSGPYTIEYIPLDDSTKAKGKWDAGQEEKNARRVAADPAAVAYIGTINSGAAKVSIPILNRVQLVQISPANTYPGLTKTTAALAGEPYVYSPLGPADKSFCRTVTTDDVQGSADALYLARRANVKSVYVLDDTELYGHGIAVIFAAKAKEIGVNVVGGPQGIDVRKSASYTDLARTIVQAKPDAVYFGGITENRPADVLQALRAAGFQGIFMGPDGITEDAFAKALPANPGRVIGTVVGLTPDQLKGSGAAWYRNWKAQHPNQEPSAYAPYAYDATSVVLDAIAKAGRQPDRQHLRAAVLNALKGEQNVQGIIGTFSFDANCDTTATTISIEELRNGNFQFAEVAPSQ